MDSVLYRLGQTYLDPHPKELSSRNWPAACVYAGPETSRCRASPSSENGST